MKKISLILLLCISAFLAHSQTTGTLRINKHTTDSVMSPGVRQLWYDTTGNGDYKLISTQAGGGGSGSGTVSSGAQYRLAYYATAGTTVSNANAITGGRALISDANGVPTQSTATATQLNYISGATGTTGTSSTNLVFSTSPTLVTPILGTPQSITLTNATGLPLGTGVTGTLQATNFPALTGDVTTTAGSLTTSIAAGAIVNADVNASAAIAYSKLNLTNSIVDGDIVSVAPSKITGITTIGTSLITLTNPDAITFPRYNADNTVSSLDAASFRTAIGAGTGSGTVTSVSGTSNRISSTGGATPVIDIDAAYVGQATITTLGTIATGTWNATTIGVTKGGTGVTSISAKSIWLANSANTITEVTPGAGQSVRINAGNTAWEAYTPGTGDVTKVGTPADNQIGVWTGNGTIEGVTGFLYDNSTGQATIDGTNAGGTFWNIKSATTTQGAGLIFHNTGTARFQMDSYHRSGGSNPDFELYNTQASTFAFVVDGNTSNLSLNNSSTEATAKLHIGAGTATAKTAPLKFTSGTNLTTAETGAVEYNGTNLFFTRTGTTRESIMTANAVNSVAPTAPNRTITVVIDGVTLYLAAKTTND